MPRSSASLQQRIASMTMPAELGESSTDSLRSSSIGMSPKRRPSARIAGDKDGNVINKTETGFHSATGVETRRLLRTNRKIIDQHLGRRITQFFDDLLTGGFFLQGQESAQWVLVAHMLGKTIENA